MNAGLQTLLFVVAIFVIASLLAVQITKETQEAQRQCEAAGGTFKTQRKGSNLCFAPGVLIEPNP